MLTNIPNAKQYILLPVAEPKEAIPVGDSRIIGKEPSTLTYSQLLLQQVARQLDDKDVIGRVGINMERCLIIVNKTPKELYTALNIATEELSTTFEDKPHLLPKGGLELIILPWEEIQEADNTAPKS